MLAGVADALREGAGSRRAASERAEADAVRAQLRMALGDDRYALAFEEGQDLSFDSALALALRTLEEKRTPIGGQN